MATKAKSTKGVKFMIGNADGPPETFSLIPEITTFQAPGVNAAEIDATSLDSTAMERIAGLQDGDAASFDYNSIYDSTTQALLRTNCAAGIKTNFKIELNDATTPTKIEFAAIITAVPGVGGGVNEVQKVSGVTLRVTGPVTVTAGTP